MPLRAERSSKLTNLLAAIARFFGLDFLIVATLVWWPQIIDLALQSLGLRSPYWTYGALVGAFFISALIRNALLIREYLLVASFSGKSIAANLLILAAALAILLKRLPEQKMIGTANAGAANLVVGALVLWAIANFCAQVISVGGPHFSRACNLQTNP
ncbi:hypothetical protein [Caenimonas aquaedulcis]|uniref:Uncharacterized protein n=1 Tax=Caenimonas aquaedulcis TaxID=2793270 RepID=A0A931MH19_9BURK|nr:hypothetical protein [Caenimonas aquaedulcis]MBG9388547.1 hypothetical protein [Caenimonas aquaedulcis]